LLDGDRFGGLRAAAPVIRAYVGRNGSDEDGMRASLVRSALAAGSTVEVILETILCRWSVIALHFSRGE